MNVELKPYDYVPELDCKACLNTILSQYPYMFPNCHEEYSEYFLRRVDFFMFIVGKEYGEILGIIYINNVNYTAGVADLNGAMLEGVGSPVYTKGVIDRFAEEAKSFLYLRRLNAYAAAFNRASRYHLLRNGFSPCGKLPEYFYNPRTNSYESVHVFSKRI